MATDDEPFVSLRQERAIRTLQATVRAQAERLAVLEQAQLTTGDITDHNWRCDGILHPAVTVDMRTPRVECRICKTQLDPVEVLRQYANKERQFAYGNKELRRMQADLRAEVEELKRKVKNLKAQARRLEKR